MVRFFLGNMQQQVFPDRDKNTWIQSDLLIKNEPFKSIAAAHNFKNMLFPHQVHGTQGLVITSENDLIGMHSFSHTADWIITNVPYLGIGILTADCVPLLLYDPITPAVGAVHAGWRGATDGVVLVALQGMVDTFGTEPRNIQVFIGPHARTCCYQVDEPFYATVMHKKFGTQAWQQKKDVLYFDLYACCVEQLYAAGVSESQIQDVGMCTICNLTYCSYRRDKQYAGRNISCIGVV